MRNLKYFAISSLSCLMNANASQFFEYQEDVYEYTRETKYLKQQFASKEPNRASADNQDTTENVEGGINE